MLLKCCAEAGEARHAVILKKLNTLTGFYTLSFSKFKFLDNRKLYEIALQ